MKLKTAFTSAALAVTFAFSTASFADKATNKIDKVAEKKEQASSWLNLSEQELVAVEAYADDYKEYIYKGTTDC